MIVSGPEAIGPERLAALVDGDPPRDDVERRMSGLLAAVRELEAGAPEALRGAVRRAAAAPAPAGATERLRARLRSAGPRRIALIAAPAAVAVAAAAVVIPALTSGGPGPARDAPPAAESAARSAQPAAPADRGAPLTRASVTRVRVRVDGAQALARASVRAIGAVRRLGGTTESAPDPGPARRTVRIVFRVPAARADEALAAVSRLGTVTAVRPRPGVPARAGPATIELTLAAASGP